MDESHTSEQCAGCGNVISRQQNYCNFCGTKQISEAVKTDGLAKKKLIRFAVFYTLNLIICLSARFIDVFSVYDYYVALELFLISITIVFAYINRKEILPLLSPSRIEFIKVFECIFIAVIFSLVVSFTVNSLNYNLFNEQQYYLYSYLPSDNPAMAMIFYVAVIPAVFEELAYRGFLWSNLEGLIEKKSIIFVISFLFSLMHLSLLSFLWLFPFALLVGYYRIAYKNIWYGIIIHFFFNLTVCLVELFEFDFI